MNTDNLKPPVAPKPKCLGPGSFRLTSPLISRACSAKPPLAPKPTVPHEFNAPGLIDNTQEGCCRLNGESFPLDEELVHGNEPEQVARGEGEVNETAKEQFGFLCSGQKEVQRVLKELEEEYESVSRGREEDMMQDSEEEWRLTGSAVRDMVGSPDSLGTGDAGLTADSTNALEVTDTDMTEEINSEGWDAGEALADTDGFSVGDFSFTSVEDEEAEPGHWDGDVQKRKKTLEGKEDKEAYYAADLLTGAFVESPTVSRQEMLKVRKEQDTEPPNDYCVTSNVLNVVCSHGILKKGENVPPYQKQRSHTFSEANIKPEPYYISSEDVIDRRQLLIDKKVAILSKSPLIQQKHLLGDSTMVLPSKYRCITDKDSPFRKSIKYVECIECVTSEDNLEIDDDVMEDKDKERTKTSHKSLHIDSEEHQAGIETALQDHFACRPRFRLVSFSMPIDHDTSQNSSISESQLTSPNDSFIFRDEEELEGHIVPFLDDTTDTEQDLSDDHVYEEAGQDLEGEMILPFKYRGTAVCAQLASGKLTHCASEMGTHMNIHKHFTGRDPTAPALTSSPMLNTVRAKSYSKPHHLSYYPRSISVGGQEMSLRLCREPEGSSRERGEDSLFLPYAFGSSGSFSQCSPMPSTGLSTPTSMLDIPPPFELAYITKKPITKSSPSLLMEGDLSDKNKKKKSSLKRFLMLKFRKKTDSKPVIDLNSPSSRSSSESINHVTARPQESDRNNLSNFSQLNACPLSSPCSSKQLSMFLSYNGGQQNKRCVAFLNRSVVRVESFEDRSRVPFVALPLTKPRSISFPNTDTSDYENIPPISSDYENLGVPRRRPVRQGAFTEFFDHPSRARSTANDTDGYVDMSSFPGFERKTQKAPEETESVYTEAYKVCSLAAGPGLAGGEDQGHTSDEEDRGAESSYDPQPDGRSRAFYIAKELMDTETVHVKALKLLQEDFREAVGAAVRDGGDGALDEDRLREILNELPDIYTLHRRILTELENRIRHWDDSQRIADVFLSKKAEFLVFTTFIGHYDRSVSLLEDSCRRSPAFAAAVGQFEQSPECENISLKHQLLRVIVRVAQYRMLLTDYLNNLRPDSKEYEDTQAAVAVVSDIADQANDSLKHGENLMRLVNIEYSVRGQKDLLQPGRVFIKEGTLMKVNRKSKQPRHLFLMNDVLLYTYPQQDGKYRLKNTLSLTGMKVTRPSTEDVQNALKIEVTNVSITLSASSSNEREDWFYTLSCTVMEHARGPAAFPSFHGEDKERLWPSLGEKPPTLVPVSQVMMCMNCTSDFSLTIRRHHCHACGRIVCRSCSRNRHPLKYMNDRMAKVCDRCCSELKARGPHVSASMGQNSPRLNRSSRPLSAVFQNIHPPNLWRHRKGTASFTQVSVSEEGTISGSLQRSKRSKRHWKRLWFLLKDKVLYTYRGQEEKVASESLPLLGFTVKLPDRQEREEEANVFSLYHKKTLYYTFKAEDNCSAQRWVNAMEEATIL